MLAPLPDDASAREVLLRPDVRVPTRRAGGWDDRHGGRTAGIRRGLHHQFKEADNTGAVLDGNNQYTVTFAKGQIPPVKGFWSLTMYNAQKFFHPNPLDLFSRGTKNKNLDTARTAR